MMIFNKSLTILKVLPLGLITVFTTQKKEKTYKLVLETGHKPKKLKILFQWLNISQKVLKENLSSRNLNKLLISLILKVVSMKLKILILIMLILIMVISLKLVSILNKLDITLMLLKEQTGNTVYPTYMKSH